ncbi:MAG TPA: bacillithiol biosynthesis deacetylase BshB1 [Thermoanaerobaculia bacterium]
MTEVDLIFIGAHPDDVELAAGGTIARAVRDGLKVGMIDLTRGEMGTRGTPAIRQREARAAARALGASFREQLDFGDGNLRYGRDEELELIEVFRATKAKLVFAPYPDDRHPDHTRTGRVVTDAWFYAGLRQLKTKRTAHRPQAVAYYLQNYLYPASFVVDTSSVWKTKMKSIAAYKSQFHDPKSKEPQTFISDPRFLQMIEARGRHFGALIGVTYGEAFVTKQPPRIDDLVGAYSGREV